MMATSDRRHQNLRTGLILAAFFAAMFLGSILYINLYR
jgi:hypothetical protein